MDGRLYLYACVYRGNSQIRRGQTNVVAAGTDGRFLYHDANNGGPNSLYRNQGSWQFVDVTAQVGLDQNNHRYSFAAAWEDLDNDGDLDLYVANDYGRNNLYRNDAGENATRRFVDASLSAGVEDSAFGMAVTLGDYNRDGLMDIYVSNMWSAAGNRVTFQPEFKADSNTVKPLLQRFAQGNSLLKNVGEFQFEEVKEAAGAHLGRWAWGTNFVDLNNDGWEDLVVANGFMTTDDTGDL